MISNHALATKADTSLHPFLLQSCKLDGLINGLKGNAEASLWAREMPAEVEAWLEACPPSALPEGRFVLKAEHVSACMSQLFEAYAFAWHPALDWLCEDVAHLATCLSRAFEVPYVRLRLDAILNDACRKFHIDNVIARLICTYRGPGTQLCLAGSESDVTDIHTVPTGQPVLLKGKLWPEVGELSLKHRSPPISGTGVTRWMMVLEGVSARSITDTEYDVLYAQD